jgi:hypothetical protein
MEYYLKDPDNCTLPSESGELDILWALITSIAEWYTTRQDRSIEQNLKEPDQECYGSWRAYTQADVQEAVDEPKLCSEQYSFRNRRPKAKPNVLDALV